MTSAVARDIDRVLRPLEGHGLYRNNAFRVTGLPTDVSARQVRRHREETQNPYYVTPAPDGDVPLLPSDDADALRGGFEVLRDPLARLVHELFWLRPDGGNHSGDGHDHAVFAHCRALEATLPDGRLTGEAAREDWKVGLRLWAQALTAEETWAWVRRRADEIDDPRLTVAVLRALRDRLQEHVIGVSVGLAVEAAGVAPADAEHHLEALHGSGFEPRQVRDVARAAVEPATDRVRVACETALSADPSAGLSAARALLDETTTALATVTAVLGPDDDLTGAVRDEVARTANNCVFGYVNDRLESGQLTPASAEPALQLLRRARPLASSPSAGALLDTNLADLENFAAGGVPVSAQGGAALGCFFTLVVLAAGGVASWWLLYNQLGLGPVWSTGGAVFGALTAVDVVGRVVGFFRRP
ncbi:hypothetical protein [Promicromonospora soli]|uniref:Uncharacterized protein n=1 Tax=Promicromonospora soli TaxID=2035533 RepID=A0A919FIU4_9MICO|nr:hypothetical protein [Promicromonospora soli]GHH66207.1 hypothetical protein GCM10017772_05710 [Promicromonospora soli]